MLKKSLWAGLGMALPLIGLAVIKNRIGWPPALPLGWLPVWAGSFVALILVIRVMDVVLKDLFARRPEMERLATGILIGCWIFTGTFLHR